MTNVYTSTSGLAQTIPIPPPPLVRRNLIILDYDDSLLPTSWLLEWNAQFLHDSSAAVNPEQQRANIKQFRQELQDLEQRVGDFLVRALQLGPVVLVTNAESGWVELSCHKYFPRVTKLLPHVKIVSARTTFESLFPGRPGEWKLQAFRNILQYNISPEHGVETNVISVGDSLYEREAVHIAARELVWGSVLIKSIQLMSRPAAAELGSQLAILNGCIHEVVEHNSHLDLLLQKTSV